MPSTSTDVLDGVSTSTAIKAPCRVATTANITLSGEQTVNGVALVSGDRILVKDQTDTTENGIWKVATGTWSRAPDWDGNRDARNGTIIMATGGTVDALKLFRAVAATDTITVATTAVTFAKVPYENVLINERLAKTANYTVLDSDTGKTVALGGSAYFTLTFDTASGYTNGFMVLVVNEDPAPTTGGGRAKKIVLTGGDTFQLFPGQSVLVFVQNDVWYRTPRDRRYKVPTGLRLKVDASSGVTDTDGLATGSGAFSSVALAISYAQANFDAGLIKIDLAAGTHAPFTVTSHTSPTQFFDVIGAGSGSTTISDTATGQAIYCLDEGYLNIGAVTITSSLGNGILCRQHAIVDIQTDVVFSTFVGAALVAADFGKINAAQNFTISGSSPIFAYAYGQGHIDFGSMQVTLTGTPNFSTAFAYAGQDGYITGPLTTASGSATGIRFIGAAGYVNTGGSTFPGNAAGYNQIITDQIKFPGTQNGSSDANTLDDYEEGTWTPALTFATPGDLSVAYTIQVGSYTKIGRDVRLSPNAVTSTFTHTTASGNFQLTGQPFPVANVSNNSHYGACQWQGITKAGYSAVVMRLAANTSLIDFVISGSAQSAAVVAVGDVPTAGAPNIRGTATYQT